MMKFILLSVILYYILYGKNKPNFKELGIFIETKKYTFSKNCFFVLIIFSIIFIGLYLDKTCSTQFIKNSLTTIGLTMDLIGILFIAYFVKKKSHSINFGGPVNIGREHYTKDSEKVQNLAYLYIASGFVIQIISTWL